MAENVNNHEVRGVSKKFGKWYQKTNKLTLLAFKIIAILHNTLLATFINILGTVSKGLFTLAGARSGDYGGCTFCFPA
jgi:hypothetical protein